MRFGEKSASSRRRLRSSGDYRPEFNLPTDREQSHRRFVRGSIGKSRASRMEADSRGPRPRTKVWGSFELLDPFRWRKWVDQVQHAPRDIRDSFHFERLHKRAAHTHFFLHRNFGGCLGRVLCRQGRKLESPCQSAGVGAAFGSVQSLLLSRPTRRGQREHHCHQQDCPHDQNRRPFMRVVKRSARQY